METTPRRRDNSERGNHLRRDIITRQSHGSEVRHERGLEGGNSKQIIRPLPLQPARSRAKGLRTQVVVRLDIDVETRAYKAEEEERFQLRLDPGARDCVSSLGQEGGGEGVRG